jgi:hypothetical protein
VLGRDLTSDEARGFTAIARRITAIVLLGPMLDANYIQAADQALPTQGSTPISNGEQA